MLNKYLLNNYKQYYYKGYQNSKRFLKGKVMVFTMPCLSPTMTNGRILELKIPIGSSIESYQHFMTVSTNTLTKLQSDINNNNQIMEIEIMEDDYYVVKYLVNINDTISINDPIAYLCENKEDIDEVTQFSKNQSKELRKCQWQGYLKS